MKQLAFVVVFALTVMQPLTAFSHEGHDHAPGSEENDGAAVTGPITISPQASQNLGLETVEAEIRPLQKTMAVIGQIEAIPNRSAAVTSRIPGQVAKLFVTEGQLVSRGEPLVEVESRQLGNPPPRVTYAAPIDGFVTDRHAVLGESVEPEKHLLEIIDLREVYAEGRVYEGQVGSVKRGQEVRIRVDSYPERVFDGLVENLAGTLDEETRTLKVWVRIKNDGLLLRPNMRTKLSIVVQETEAAVVVPREAILGEAGNFFVFVQSPGDPNTFQRTNVVVGLQDDRYAEIIEGLAPGDRVATQGNYQLQYVPPMKKPEGANK